MLKIVAVAVLASAAWLAYALLAPIDPGRGHSVLLRAGTSTRKIAAQLRDEHVIRSAPAFLLLHYLRPAPLKAGEYIFDKPANALEVYERLARGDIFFRTVTVPEGYNMFEVAAALETAGLGSRQDFLRVARGDLGLVSDLDPQATSLEGYLFPDTYRFTRTQSMHDIAAVMTRRFRQEARAIGLKSDFHRVVTMASIVEKETDVPAERPLVASVYFNRLARTMLFNADPTVVYASVLAGRYSGVIHESDLHLDSPYNTYRYPGLPPGPIANPGAASLKAAMAPATTNYLYFVSDNEGHHRFARTAEEHARNVAAYRRAAKAEN